MDANDLLQEGFIKVFENLHNFRNQGSLEGWIRKTFINTAINYCKQKYRLYESVNIDDYHEYIDSTNNNEYIDNIIEHSHYKAEELLQIINNLPSHLSLVFNLYAIEGYSHKEIAEMLNIPVGTSKSHLHKARKLLQETILKISKKNIIYEKEIR